MSFKALEVLIKIGELEPRGVVHVGAHLGQELGFYKKLGFKHVVFVEADPTTYSKLCELTANDPAVKNYNYALSSSNTSTSKFYVTSNQGKSSSLLEPKLHYSEFPTVKVSSTINVGTTTLDSFSSIERIDHSTYNVLVTDVQGADLEVLKGGSTFYLQYVDAIVTEVNIVELYEGCGLLPEVDAFLLQHRFDRTALEMVTKSYGDALYVKRKLPCTT